MQQQKTSEPLIEQSILWQNLIPVLQKVGIHSSHHNNNNNNSFSRRVIICRVCYNCLALRLYFLVVVCVVAPLQLWDNLQRILPTPHQFFNHTPVKWTCYLRPIYQKASFSIVFPIHLTGLKPLTGKATYLNHGWLEPVRYKHFLFSRF